jgi:hypothetical protein
MKENQCQKYMAIAKSNTHPGGYLDINSEVLLLAFDPEEREVCEVIFTAMSAAFCTF